MLTDANVRNRWVALQKEDRQAGTQRTRRVSLWLEVAVSSSDAAKLCLGHLLAAEHVKASVASYRNRVIPVRGGVLVRTSMYFHYFQRRQRSG